MKKKLLALLALAMMLGAIVAGPVLASPADSNGNHYGNYAHPNNGMHIGAGAGLGKDNNLGLYPERRGLK